MNRDARYETRDSIEDSLTVPPRSAVRVPTLDTLSYAHGGSLAEGRIRSEPADFIVREYLGFHANGEGEHLLLTVRKRSANTKWIAKQIADRAGVRVRDVGFSGMKDRHAIAEQSFTVPALKTAPESWIGFGSDEFEVIAAARQRRKLRRGAHRGNFFEVIVRDFAVDRRQLEDRMQSIRKLGVPNYFGDQRFGVDNHNLHTAERWLCDGVAPATRDDRSFALSAARSALFNAVLSARVSDGTWNRLIPGEVVNLDGTNSVFASSSIDATLETRCAQLDVHPTGPLCGYGESRVQGEALRFEESVLAPWRSWRDGLIALRVEQQRRALRSVVADLGWEYEAKTLKLRFRLSRGAFATAVLREIVAY